MTYLQLTGGSLAGMLGITALVGTVAATGLGDRIFNNLSLDSSASVRLRVWDAFDYLSTTDVWMGVSPLEIDHISLRMGLDPTYEAIENFWIYLFMQFGLIGFIPFLVGLACLLRMLWKSTNTPLKLSIVLYLLVGSTANTLASKTVSLMLLTTAILASTKAWPAAAPTVRVP
jgi:O-antigen ligase